MAKLFRKLPSEIMHITSDYEAFCFDEACFYVQVMIADGKEPLFFTDADEEEPKHYTSFKDMYDSYLK